MKRINVRNFRNISGYSNEYGESINENMLFRGGSLDRLSREDQKYFYDQLHIKYVLDYRDEIEAGMNPDIIESETVYRRIPALQFIASAQNGFDFGNMLKGEMTKDKLQSLLDYLYKGYEQMAFNNPAYQELFKIMMRNDGNIYFHCTAGKDRTGIGAFLIMIALGFHEDEAIKEYLLSNEYLKEENQKLSQIFKIPQEMQEECESLLYVQKEFIQCTIQAIKEKYHDYDEFLKQEYGLDETRRTQLRRIYCTANGE